MVSKRWPLHPQPYKNQFLYHWVKDLAAIYEVSYRKFCIDVLKLMQCEISRLDTFVPEKALAILSTSTGIALDDLRYRTFKGVFEKLLKESKSSIDQYLTEDEFIKYVSSIKNKLSLYK
jgi:hypothetical protein